jgi:hypothetical protein
MRAMTRSPCSTFTRTEEQVGAAVFTLHETESVLVAQHTAADQVEFFDHAQVAAPVAHDLAIAFHRADAPAERIAIAFADVELPGQIFFLHRHAGLDQDFQYQFTARHRVFVTFGFARLEGVAIAPRGLPGGSGFFRFFHLN